MHEFFEHGHIFSADLCFKSMRQLSIQRPLPARSGIVQISPPSGELACRVDLYAFSGPNDPDQFAFGQHLAAANAGTLRDMLASFAFFCGHVSSASNLGLIQEFFPVLLVPLFSVAFAAAADNINVQVRVVFHFVFYIAGFIQKNFK